MKWLRGLLAVVTGLVIGSAVNMGLILIGSHLVPAPVGVDVTDAESIRAGIELFQPKHFLFPFLAHALGTLVGATCAGFIAPGRRNWFSYGIGTAFLAGGIATAFMIPAPMWYLAADLCLAYLPMAWVAGRINGVIFKPRTVEP